MDHVLVGYGQVPGNPLFYYCLPVRKVVSKMKMRVLGKYKIPLALCDYHSRSSKISQSQTEDIFAFISRDISFLFSL